jgi:hypothetical protein
VEEDRGVKGTDYCSAGADISACGKYRYKLWREWRGTAKDENWNWYKNDDGSPVVDGAGEPWGDPKPCAFIMLNPSTADAKEDDPTIRRCVGYAKRWGYDRLEVANLFAWRATDPQVILKMTARLKDNHDPVGPRNSEVVRETAIDAGLIICAWGAHGNHMDQDTQVLGWINDCKLHILRTTKSGHPAHPLYLPANLTPVRFVP